MRKNIILLLGLLAGFAGGPAPQAVEVRGSAPDFTLDSRAGKPLTLSELRGQVVMISFWVSWCVPCRHQMPLLEQIYENHKSLGFTLLSVDVESEPHGAENVLQETPVSFPVLFDRDSKVSKLYGVAVYDVNSMPITVVIDRKGNVSYFHRGYAPGDESTYLTHIRSLIKE